MSSDSATYTPQPSTGEGKDWVQQHVNKVQDALKKQIDNGAKPHDIARLFFSGLMNQLGCSFGEAQPSPFDAAQPPPGTLYNDSEDAPVDKPQSIVSSEPQHSLPASEDLQKPVQTDDDSVGVLVTAPPSSLTWGEFVNGVAKVVQGMEETEGTWNPEANSHPEMPGGTRTTEDDGDD